eukprot:Clim_evm59s218 gene=Clim_evmTU59s218
METALNSGFVNLRVGRNDFFRVPKALVLDDNEPNDIVPGHAPVRNSKAEGPKELDSSGDRVPFGNHLSTNTLAQVDMAKDGKSCLCEFPNIYEKIVDESTIKDKMKTLECEFEWATLSDGRTGALRIMARSKRSLAAAVGWIEEVFESTWEMLPAGYAITLPISSAEVTGEVNRRLAELDQFSSSGEIEIVNAMELHVTACKLRCPFKRQVEKVTKTLLPLSRQCYDAVETRTCLATVSGFRALPIEGCHAIVADVELDRDTHRLRALLELLHSKFTTLCDMEDSEIQSKGYRLGASNQDMPWPAVAVVAHVKSHEVVQQILSTLGVSSLGSARLASIQLSELGAVDPKTQYFKSLASISLP